MNTGHTLPGHVGAARARDLLRIVTGYLFIWHGSAKLFAHPARRDVRRPAALLPDRLAGVLELVGGALLIAGLFIRPTAFILSGFMAVAYFMGHGSKGTCCCRC
jgi:putative oxidoreductase